MSRAPHMVAPFVTFTFTTTTTRGRNEREVEIEVTAVTNGVDWYVTGAHDLTDASGIRNWEWDYLDADAGELFEDAYADWLGSAAADPFTILVEGVAA